MPQPAHLAALVAVVDHGTFEAAARALQVTPSAVSQRIRALETEVGQVVVTRTAPCRPTTAGEVLVVLGRQTAELTAEARRRLGGPGEASGPWRAGVAVNADSLATWFHGVLGDAADWEGVALELHVEDQAHSTRLLREGRVLAAVTSERRPVQGCTSTALGSLAYHPVAAPSVLARAGGGPDGLDLEAVDFARVPMVRFNEVDDLQHAWLRDTGRARPAVVHRVPTTADFAEAVRRGLGWGMYLDGQLRQGLEGGDVVALAPGRPLVVPLFWQRWRLASAHLDRLTDSVLAHAPGGGPD